VERGCSEFFAICIDRCIRRILELCRRWSSCGLLLLPAVLSMQSLCRCVCNVRQPAAMSFTSDQQRSLRPAAQTCNQPHTAVYNSKHTTRVHQHVCQAVDPLFTLASTDPSALQVLRLVIIKHCSHCLQFKDVPGTYVLQQST